MSRVAGEFSVGLLRAGRRLYPLLSLRPRGPKTVKMVTRACRTCSILLGILLSASSARAQGAPTTFQFSFSNPGARSLGLGGAFVALAADATAAFANPAGLV